MAAKRSSGFKKKKKQTCFGHVMCIWVVKKKKKGIITFVADICSLSMVMTDFYGFSVLVSNSGIHPSENKTKKKNMKEPARGPRERDFSTHRPRFSSRLAVGGWEDSEELSLFPSPTPAPPL